MPRHNKEEAAKSPTRIPFQGLNFSLETVHRRARELQLRLQSEERGERIRAEATV